MPLLRSFQHLLAHHLCQCGSGVVWECTDARRMQADAFLRGVWGTVVVAVIFGREQGNVCVVMPKIQCSRDLMYAMHAK